MPIKLLLRFRTLLFFPRLFLRVVVSRVSVHGFILVVGDAGDAYHRFNVLAALLRKVLVIDLNMRRLLGQPAYTAQLGCAVLLGREAACWTQCRLNLAVLIHALECLPG